jgi:hypothetical protein
MQFSCLIENLASTKTIGTRPNGLITVLSLVTILPLTWAFCPQFEGEITVKKILAVVALGLGMVTFAVQAHNERKATPKVLLPDGPPPDCFPDCARQ